jgi:sulfatase maturation enzyme AslB (radical SAM superfamily)
MQSNASFVNKEWIAHFKKWNVGVGFSYDGVNNDKTRGHTDLILNNIKLMNDNGLHTG